MARIFVRKLLVLIVVFTLISLLLQNPLLGTQITRQISLSSLGLMQLPVDYPSSNGSTHESTSFPMGHDQNSNANQAITPTQSSQWKVPNALVQLAQCSMLPNDFPISHVALPNLLYNISMSPRSAMIEEKRRFWNPTIVSLPGWATNQYLIVSMVLPTDEGYRKNVLCEANICIPRRESSKRRQKNHCSGEDLKILGPHGGLRCVTDPVMIDLPLTPAEKCEGLEQGLADIPGFHDPRLLYSGKGEPLLMVVSQSQYACIGLWVIDVRVIHPPLLRALDSSPKRLGPGPVIAYPDLTELTRNPPSARQPYEKNWVLFSPSPSASYLQYELTPSQRTFAKLIGAGLTTPNLTDPMEMPCLYDLNPNSIEQSNNTGGAVWHQATPSLRLVLCKRTNTSCLLDDPQTVIFAAIHRKHVNEWGLPIRYDRYFVVWSDNPPFNLLAISKRPILFANETPSSWLKTENLKIGGSERREFRAGFTYTTTIAYAWGREKGDVEDMGIGYLDDKVILSIGVDDQDQVYGIAAVFDLLQCLRICPGRL